MTLRRPRAAVLLNGEQIPWVDIEVESNATWAADTFRVTVPTIPTIGTADGIATVARLLSGAPIAADIRAGFPADAASSAAAAALPSIITGRVDTVEYSPGGRLVTLTGRDHTALLIDAPASESWRNMSASQVAVELARRHGLKADVQATARKVGALEGGSHYHQSAMTEWDALCSLAQLEGCVVYVRGDTLTFRPRGLGADYIATWSDTPGEPGTIIAMQASRSLTVARDAVAVIKSWSASAKRTITATYPASAKGRAKPGTPGATSPTVYTRHIPGLTQAQADARAVELHRSITAHEMRITVDLPADGDLTLESRLVVRGTGTAADQTYYPETVVRRMSPSGGYTMTVTAKNRAPENNAP